jgi:hypothetical protein
MWLKVERILSLVNTFALFNLTIVLSIKGKGNRSLTITILSLR